MKEYKASAIITTPPETVWAILQDTTRYPEWDTTCDRIEGRLAIGERIQFYSKLRPGRATTFQVTELTATHKMVWRGGMPFGLLENVRTFILTAKDSDTTKISVKESFRGPALLLLGGSIPDGTASLRRFVNGIKSSAESKE